MIVKRIPPVTEVPPVTGVSVEFTLKEAGFLEMVAITICGPYGNERTLSLSFSSAEQASEVRDFLRALGRTADEVVR